MSDVQTLVLIATDPDSGEPLAEILNASDRGMSFNLNSITSLGFSVKLDNALADMIMNDDLIIKAYVNKDLWDNFEVLTAEEVAGDGTNSIAVTAFGGLNRCGTADQAGRLVGKSTTGFTATADRGVIAGNLINSANGDIDTGIRVGSIFPSAIDTVGPWYYKPLGEAILEMSTPIDGYDFQLLPLEPQTNAGKFWEFSAGPVLGAYNPGVVFEYGMGRKNVKSYRRPVDRKGRLNDAYSLPPGFPPTGGQPTIGTTQRYFDPTSIANHGIRAGVIPSDLVDNNLRRYLCQEHVEARKEQRELAVFESALPDGTKRVPQFKVDYDIGDIITGRAYNPLTRSMRFEGLFRVYGVDVTVSDTGVLVPALKLVAQ